MVMERGREDDGREGGREKMSRCECWVDEEIGYSHDRLGE